jgi:hypothetical protein
MAPQQYVADIKAKLVASAAVATITFVEERLLPDRGYFRARSPARHWRRVIPSFCMRDRSVLGGRPRWASGVLATPASCLLMSPHALRVPAALATTAKTPNGVNLAINWVICPMALLRVSNASRRGRLCSMPIDEGPMCIGQRS